MNKKKQNIRLIESTGVDKKTIILEIIFSSKNDIRELFTPKLKNITFFHHNNTMRVALKNPDIRELFNDWARRFDRNNTNNESSDILIKNFNSEIKALIKLGQQEKETSLNAIKGLYAEFLTLESLLLLKKYPQIDVLEGWHRPHPANHDFDYNDCSIEVKAISRSKTTVQINSEHQLIAVEKKPLFLHLYRIDHVENSNEDSLGALFLRILELLEPKLKHTFSKKCGDDKFFQYLGPKDMPFEYKFTTIESFKYNVDQEAFPRIKKDDIHPGLSKIKYNIDVSSIDEFKINL